MEFYTLKVIHTLSNFGILNLKSKKFQFLKRETSNKILFISQRTYLATVFCWKLLSCWWILESVFRTFKPEPPISTPIPSCTGNLAFSATADCTRQRSHNIEWPATGFKIWAGPIRIFFQEFETITSKADSCGSWAEGLQNDPEPLWVIWSWSWIYEVSNQQNEVKWFRWAERSH